MALHRRASRRLRPPASRRSVSSSSTSARALAVTFMLYGHTASALLAPDYQVGAWFRAWQFQRGLTSSLFLMLGGFAFSVATSRHWTLTYPLVAARC